MFLVSILRCAFVLEPNQISYVKTPGFPRSRAEIWPELLRDDAAAHFAQLRWWRQRADFPGSARRQLAVHAGAGIPPASNDDGSIGLPQPNVELGGWQRANSPSSQNLKCGGVGVLSGAVDGQTVTLAINEGGTTINLSGTLSSDGKSMSGNFAGLNGGCYTSPTSGTWTASLIPPITGSFTGTITNSLYMTLLTGANPPAPIAVSGMLTQVGGTGSSNASVTGTITAVDYPCFRTASVSGTISGQNVYLLVFGFDGQQIGEIGAPPSAPATVVVQSTGVSLVGANPGTSGLALGGTSVTGSFGPCPAIVTTQGSVPYDQAAFTFSF